MSWFLATAWMALLYYTIPRTPDIRKTIVHDWGWGREGFTFMAAGFGLLCALPAVGFLVRHRSRFPARRIAGVLLVLAVFVAGAFHLAARSAEEAMHFVQYGVLYGLVLRALLHRGRDGGVFVLAWLVCVIAGALDEWIQWAVPGRYWDFRDLVLNGVSALFGLAFFTLGPRPVYPDAPLAAATLRHICRAGLVLVLILAASCSNTPAATRALVEAFPRLAESSRGWDEMAEYGHLVRDPVCGVFRSRLSPDQLAATDRARAVEAAARLPAADTLNLDAYRAFIERECTPLTDPFLHELRVHLFRRDKYLVHDFMPALNERRRAATIAWCEHLILRARHPATPAARTPPWSAEEAGLLEADGYLDGYESRPLAAQGELAAVPAGARTNLTVRLPPGATPADALAGHTALRDAALRAWRDLRSGKRWQTYRKAAHTALGETLILETYFPETMARYPVHPDEYWRRMLERDSPPPREYESPVSASLITSMSREAVLGVLAGVAGLLLLLHRRAGRNISRRNG
ncbi:MAG: VanZ family protein [Kiritimatiellia bacterium]